MADDSIMIPSEDLYLNAADTLRALDQRIELIYVRLREKDGSDKILDELAHRCAGLESVRRLLAGCCDPEWTVPSCPVRTMKAPADKVWA